MPRTSWQFWIGVGVSLALLVVLGFQVDLAEVSHALVEANYLYLAPSVALYFIAVYFRSARWCFLLSPLRSLSARRLYPVIIIGYMANNLLPARLGELVRSYYLSRREQVNASAALATIAVERIYDGLTLLAVAAISGLVLLLLGEFDHATGTSQVTVVLLASLTVFLFLGGLVILTALAVVPQADLFLDRCLALLPARLRPRAGELAHTFTDGLKILNSPSKHFKLFLMSLPVWLLEGAVYFLLSFSFGLDSYFSSVWVLILVIALVTATSNLVTALPTAIGGIGPFEVVAQQTLLAVGVGASVAGTYSGFLHLVALWLPVNLVGLVLLWHQNLSLRRLATATRPAHAHASANINTEDRLS